MKELDKQYKINLFENEEDAETFKGSEKVKAWFIGFHDRPLDID